MCLLELVEQHIRQGISTSCFCLSVPVLPALCCRLTGSCTRKFCFFAHSVSELRTAANRQQQRQQQDDSSDGSSSSTMVRQQEQQPLINIHKSMSLDTSSSVGTPNSIMSMHSSGSVMQLLPHWPGSPQGNHSRAASGARPGASSQGCYTQQPINSVYSGSSTSSLYSTGSGISAAAAVAGAGSSSSSLCCYLPSWPQQQQHRLAKAVGAKTALPAATDLNSLVLMASPATANTDIPCLQAQLFGGSAAAAAAAAQTCFSQQQAVHSLIQDNASVAMHTAPDTHHYSIPPCPPTPAAATPQVAASAASPVQASTAGAAAAIAGATAAATMQYRGAALPAGKDSSCQDGAVGHQQVQGQVQELLQLIQQQLVIQQQQQQQSWGAAHQQQQLTGSLGPPHLLACDPALVNALTAEAAAGALPSTGSSNSSNNNLFPQIHLAGAAAAAGTGSNIWCILPQQQLDDSSAASGTAGSSWADPGGTLAAHGVQLLSAAAAATSCPTNAGMAGGGVHCTAPVSFLL